jgi:hypothetical protein
MNMIEAFLVMSSLIWACYTLLFSLYSPSNKCKTKCKLNRYE